MKNNTLSKENRQTTPILPKSDLYEENGNYLIELEMPGILKENIDISLNSSVLKITGNPFLNEENNGGNAPKSFHYERMFRIPEGETPENVDASYKEGILRIKIQKPEGVQPKKILVE